jgi:hypothetical protein
MRPKWVVVLLVVSLVGNALELSLYARAEWRRHQESQKFGKFVESLAVSRYPRVVVGEFEPRMQALKQRKIRWETELQWQDYQQQPDSAVARLALDSVASITRQKFELLYQSRRALPAVEDPGLRKRMEKRWREQMGLPPEEHPKPKAR